MAGMISGGNTVVTTVNTAAAALRRYSGSGAGLAWLFIRGEDG
jgi:hypothetical protein